jgi:hypothetical protein
MTYPQSTFKDGPLKTLISCRVRLTDEQRQAMKASYRAKRDQLLPVPDPVMKGSSVSVRTSFGGTTDLDRKLGLDSILVSDVLSSRDSLSLLAILQLQDSLEVPVITHEDFIASCEHYWSHVTCSIRK